MLSPHYAPRPTVGSVRVTGYCNELTQLGWEVRVITRRENKYDAASEAGVLRVRDPLSRYRNDNQMSEPVGNRERSWRLGSIMRTWVRNILSFPDPDICWAIRVIAIERASRWRPDVIVASGPPFSTFIAASSIARHWNVPWVADYRDLWTLSTYYPHSQTRRRGESRLERRLLARALAAITVSEPLAKDLVHHGFIEKVHVVMNGYDPKEFSMVSGPRTEGPLRIVYAGEIYRGKRDPSPLFEAVRRSGLTVRDIQLDFYGASVQPVLFTAEKFGIGALVATYPRLDRQQILAVQQSADVLLLLLWNHPGEAGVYSGKLFEYIGCRRPILMLGYENGVAAQLIRQHILGVATNDVGILSKALEDWIHVKRTRGEVPKLSHESVRPLERRIQVLAMHELLCSLIGYETAHASAPAV